MNKDIKTYIEQFPSGIQDKLNELYNILKEVVPESTIEKMSWQMPTFYLNGNLVHFTGHKNHAGLYPGASGIENFVKKFDEKGLKYSKGALQLEYTKDFPKELIQEIVRFRVKENE